MLCCFTGVIFLNCNQEIVISFSLSPDKGQPLNRELGKNRDNKEF